MTTPLTFPDIPALNRRRLIKGAAAFAAMHTVICYS